VNFNFNKENAPVIFTGIVAMASIMCMILLFNINQNIKNPPKPTPIILKEAGNPTSGPILDPVIDRNGHNK
jgi:hypothetical protein